MISILSLKPTFRKRFEGFRPESLSGFSSIFSSTLSCAFFILAVLTGLFPARALCAENLLKDGGMETLCEPGSVWHFTGGFQGKVSAESEPFSGPAGAVIRADGNRFLKIQTEEKGRWGAVQEIVLDPPSAEPLRFGGRACVNGMAKAVPDGNADFDVYVDAFYEDGTPLWGQKAIFSPKISGWQSASGILWPEKPLKRIQVFVFFRDHVGGASFDDFFVEKCAPSLERFQVVGGLTGPGSIAVSGRLLWNPKFWADDFRAELCELKSGKSSISDSDSDSVSADSNVLRQIPLEFQPDRLTFFAAAGSTGSNGVKTFRFRIRNEGKILFEKVFDCETSSSGTVPLSLWLESSMRRVYLNSLPETTTLFDAKTFPETEPRPQTESFAAAASLPAPAPRLDLARGESESFQLAVHSSIEIPKVTLTFSDLVSSTEPQTKISASSCEWQQVGYLKTPEIIEHSKEKNGRPVWYPDVLLPRESGFVPANQTVSFWVTVSVPSETRPGTYRGTMTWTPEIPAKTASEMPLSPIEIPLEVTVYPITIPEEGHLGNAFALMDGFLEKVYGTQTEAELKTLHHDFGKLMLRNRLTPEGDISRTEMPSLDLLQEWDGHGLGTFNLLNLVSPRGKAPWRCNSPIEFYSAENREKFLTQLRPYVEKLRELGLSDRAYAYTFDETDQAFNAAMTDFFGMIKKNFPEVATFTTARIPTDPKLMKQLNVDWACPLTPSYDVKKAEACRKEGLKVWSYICCGPGQPYANIMLRFPLIESRILGWQAFDQNYDGILYWGVNIWDAPNNVPIDPNAGLFLDWQTGWKLGGKTMIYGDGRLLYPGIDGKPFSCLRLANLRDAYEDYELLWMLSQKKPELAREFCGKVFCTLTEFTHDPEILTRQHRELLRALSDLESRP